MENFIARYEENGIRKSVLFDKIKYDTKKAEKWLSENGIKNFFFFFEPEEPKEIGENKILFKGEVGFDITLDSMLPHIMDGKEIVLDTYGGDLWESLKIYDLIKSSGLNPTIGVLGTCASAGMQILLSANPENRWISPNSRGLIHNPWTCMCGDDEIFNKTAKELEEEKLNIANIYAMNSGKPLNDILSLMKQEKILNAEEMQELNFANIRGYNNSNNNSNNSKDEEMTEKESKQLGVIENMLNNLKNRLFPVKNLILQDVNGTEIDFGDEIETSDQIQVGSTATVDGQPAEGEYTMNDGTVYVFEGGEVTEIRMPEEEEEDGQAEASAEELQEEVNNLQTENSELQNKLTTSDARIKELETEAERIHNEFKDELLKVQNEFTAFKNQFSNEKADLNVPAREESGNNNKPKFSFKSKK